MSIQVRNLSHIYAKGMPDEQIALENINFEIYDNEVVGVIGHTGSGKSTLLQHLNGLLKPHTGTILIGDTDITKEGVSMRDIRKKVGLVFQYPEYQLFEETVATDIAFGPKNLGLSDEEIEDRVKESLELVGLNYESFKDRSPFELSGGQKRRVAIAGVLAMKPAVLILDEPTAGLDPGAHKEILEMIKKVHESQENIILFVSHNMADVAELSDKVMVMNDGKLEMFGTPEEVFLQKERLENIGLNTPPITELLCTLKDNGVDVRTNLWTVKEAKEEIYNYLQRKMSK